MRRLPESPFWPLFGREFGLGVPQCRAVVGPELVRLQVWEAEGKGYRESATRLGRLKAEES